MEQNIDKVKHENWNPVFRKCLKQSVDLDLAPQ